MRFPIRGLACEHSRNPVGVGTKTLLFTWFPPISATVSALQLRITGPGVPPNFTVPIDSPTLQRGWEEVIVPSIQSLQSYHAFLVDSRAEQVSETVRVVTGPIDSSLTMGKWIGAGENSRYSFSGHAFTDVIEEEHAVMLAGHMDLAALNIRAENVGTVDLVFALGAIGSARLSVNGFLIDDVIQDPPPVDYRVVAPLRVLHIDVSTLSHILQSGDVSIDAVPVTVLLGNGRALPAYEMPRPSAMVCAGANGITVGVTDESWQWTSATITENGTYRGEVWNLSNKVNSPRPVEVRPTPISVRSLLVPPTRPTTVLVPRSVERGSNGEWIVDFGQNMSGVVELDVPPEEELDVSILHAEHVTQEGALDRRTNRAARQELLIKGKAPYALPVRAQLSYQGFRYASVGGLSGPPAMDSIRAYLVTTDVAQVSSFSCSEKSLDRLHSIILWGQRSNMVGIPTDCPQRDERQGWLGDAHLVVREAMLNFDAYHFFEKYLDDIKDSQRADGSLCDVAPAYWPLYPADPAWGAAYSEILWSLWWHRGDVRLVRKHLPAVTQWVKFMLTSLDDDGILRKLSKYGDWCPPGSIFPKRTPIELTSTWALLHDLDQVVMLSQVIGDGATEKWAKTELERLVDSFNRSFLTPEGGYQVLRMSPRDNLPGQTSNVLPLSLGIVPSQAFDRVVNALLDSIRTHHDRHLDTGIIGTRYLFEVLSKLGHGELALDIALSKTYPSFGHMMQQGATTLWERWEDLQGGGMNSHNHIMLGSIDVWLQEWVAGLRATSSRWKSIELEPIPDRRIDAADLELQTCRGTVAFHWRRDKNQLSGTALVPGGSGAELLLPAEPAQNPQVVIDGVTIKEIAWSQRGLHNKYHAVVLSLAPGEHSFSMTHDS